MIRHYRSRFLYYWIAVLHREPDGNGSLKRGQNKQNAVGCKAKDFRGFDFLEFSYYHIAAIL
jgi:hypothetical protein